MSDVLISIQSRGATVKLFGRVNVLAAPPLAMFVTTSVVFMPCLRSLNLTAVLNANGWPLYVDLLGYTENS